MTTIEDVIARSQHKSLMARTTNLQLFWVFVAAVVACVALTLLTDTFATERNLFNVANVSLSRC